MKFRQRLGWSLFAAVVVSSLASGQESRPEPVDILIRGGTIVDGTGNPWFKGDVVIRGDRIEAVGSLATLTARTPHHRCDRPDRHPRIHRYALAFGSDAPGRRLRPEQDPPGGDDRNPGRGHLGGAGQGEARSAIVEARRRNARVDDSGRVL